MGREEGVGSVLQRCEICWENLTDQLRRLREIREGIVSLRERPGGDSEKTRENKNEKGRKKLRLGETERRLVSGLLPVDILLVGHQSISGGKEERRYRIGRALVRGEDVRRKLRSPRFSEVESKVALGEEKMSIPGFEHLKYCIRVYVVEEAVTGYASVQVVGDDTREDVPTEVVSGDVGLDGASEVKEGCWGTINWVDVYYNNEVNRCIWVKSNLELMVAVYEFDDFCPYRGVNLVRVEGEECVQALVVIPVRCFQISIGKDHCLIGGGDVSV